MKRDLQKMIAFVAMLFLPFSLLAQTMDPAYGIVIDESFEKGIPADWTQENVVGSIAWIGENSDLTYPNGASDSLGRIAFRNTTGVTQKAVTRLVLPPVDVAALFQPVLIFSHAQDKWSGDFDSLRVLCRTSANGAWNTIAAYDNYIARWQRDTVFLPSQTYVQLAFEAVDNLGRGIVIDDVVIRSTPSCFDPEGLYTSNVTNNSITVNWTGSFDAEYFYVKLSETVLSEAELASPTTVFVCDTTTDGVSMDFANLIQGTKYHCYVKSQCEHEISAWAYLEIKTANIINVPDTITFERPEGVEYTSATPYFMDGWYYAAAKDDYKPYGNANLTDWKYGASADGSGALIFAYYTAKTPYHSYLGSLPADTWAYAATPEINNMPIKDLQITFETFTYYEYVADQFAITVGVMTDPEDRSTFVPVKTIYNPRPFICEEFVVSFENYTGEGKYIAFMSDFEKSNRFCIDNLIIEPRKEVVTPQFDIMMTTASTMQFKFEQQYDSYEVILSTSEYSIDRGQDFPDTLEVLSKHTIANMGVISDLTPDARYFVYARAIKGDKKGRWAFPRYVEMPSRIEVSALPYTIDFEAATTTVVSSIDMNGYSSSSNSIPKIIKPLFTYPSSAFKVEDSATWAASNYIMAKPLSGRDFFIGCYYYYDPVTIAVFPEVDDVTRLKVSFNAVARIGSASLNPASNLTNYKSKAAVGVMTDANDMNTFIPIDTIEPSYLEYGYYEYDFSTYPQAQGRFFAIKVEAFDFVTTSSGYTNKVNIDNVIFARSLDCKSPSNMEAEVDPNDPSKATITWSANGVTEWNVRVATTEYDKNLFTENDGLEFVYNSKVTAPKAELTGLKYPYQTYYYWIQPVCEGIAGEWTMVRNFETFCPLVHTVPYLQDFESAKPGSNIWTGFTVDCAYAKQWSRNIPNTTPSGRYDNKFYFPSVTNTRGYNSNQSFPIFKKYSSSSRNYIALPELDKPIDSLQVSFRIFSHQSSQSFWNTQEIAVGVMTDPMDMNTFEQIALVKPSKQTTWERVVVKFDEYVGQGKHIAIRETDKFTCNPSSSSDYTGGKNLDTLYVDNIEVNIAAPCDIPYDIYASDVTPNAATINWQSDANEFIVVVANAILSENDLVDFDDYKAGRLSSFAKEASIVATDTVVGAHSVRVNELTVNQDYYVYIKAFCQNMYTDYAVDYTFSTFCPAMPVESFLANFSDAATGTLPDCWVVGQTIGAYQSGQSILNYIKVQTTSSTSDAYYTQTNCVLLSSTNGALVSTTGKPNINGTYLVAPTLDIDKITNYKVKFKAWTGTSYMFTGCGSYDYARSVIVGVVTNPYNFETFMPVDTIENIHYNVYPYEVYLDSYKYDLNGDTGKFVAFYSNFDIRNNIYIDDVELELIDECPRFEAKVVSSTPSSITLEFNDVPESYVVKATASTPVTILKSLELLENDSLCPPTVATSKTVTIEGLKNHKEYFFYARPAADTLCTEWQLVTSAYAADSLAKALPFNDNFESNPYSASYGECPHDWYGLYKDGDVSYPTVGSTAKSGTKAAYLYNPGAADIYLVSPELLVDKLNNCYLEFNAYAGAVSSYPTLSRALTVGVVSDPNNIAGTFTPLDTVLFTPDLLAKWNYYKLELTNVPSNAKHIAFLLDYAYNVELFPTYKYATVHVDDVVVDYIPTCYVPNSFASKVVTDNSIALNFKHEGAVRYEAIYGYNGFNLDSVEVSPSYAYAYGVDTISFTGQEFSINSLRSEVTYDVYVRALCTEQDASNWVFAGSYKTLPSMISSFPYFNGFEDPVENSNWKHHGASGYDWYMGVDKDSLVADKKNSTDFALYYSCDGGLTTKHNKKSAAAKTYRYIQLTEGTYEFSYDWVAANTPRLTTSQALFEQNLVRVLLMPASVTFSSTAGFKTEAGKSISFSYIDPVVGNLPDDWFELSDIYNWGVKQFGALWGTDLSLPLEQQWKRRTVNVTIDKETEGTYMLVFFFYGTTKSTDSDGYRAAAIDNLSIIKSECGSVNSLNVTDRMPTSATLNWTSSNNSIASYEVLVLNENVDPNSATDAQKAYAGTASATSVNVTGLQPFTKYYAFVRPTCDSQYNLWGDSFEFTTEVSVSDGYTFSFEEEEMLYYRPYNDSYMYEINGDKTYNNTITMNHKWVNVSLVEANNTTPANYNFNKSYASYHPQIAYDTLRSSSTYHYGRTGKHALWLGSRTTSAWMNGATAAMPYAGEFDGKRLIFYMRCFATYTSSATAEYVSTYYPTYFSSTVALNNQSRKITVGTMTDPNDATTFVPLDTVQYPFTNSDYASGTNILTKDPSGDKGWYRVVLNLDGVQGKYVAFRYEHYGTATADKTLNMFIDDVTIETIPACPAPELMKINKLKESFVEIDYYYIGDEAPKTAVEISTDENFMTNVIRDTFNTVPFTVTGLNPLTKYYVRAQVICSDLDKSGYSATMAFETPKNVCYDNNFDAESTHYPTNWVHTFNPTHDSFVKNNASISGAGIPGSGNTWGFKLKPGIFENGDFSTKHLVGITTSNSANAGFWAISPLIALDDDAEQHLSFKLALTKKGSAEPFDVGLLALDTLTSFGVFICEGDNFVYNPDDMTLWKNAKNSKYNNVLDFLSIPTTGAEYSIDLSKYKGKNIKVLFNISAGVEFELHIDDIHINKYVEKEYEASTCEFCDYEDNNFFILSNNVELGVNKFHKWELQSENPDTMLVLNLNVADVSETNISATICEGDVYNENGFTGLVQDGVYRRKFTSVGQCDSIVSLALNVVKPKLTTLADTICFGTTYQFGSRELNRTGLYVDTLVSQVTGCDSIVTLLLTVKDVIRTEQYVNICYGDTYTFGTQTISTTGKYEEVFQTSSGCDSLVTLHATVLPEYRQNINAVIKKGEEYNANGFKGLTRTGEYTLELKSVEGCDSVIVLNLTVLEGSYNELDVNICYGDSYQLGSQTITTTGQYTETFKAANGADSVVVVNATVLPDYRQTIEATICAGEVYTANGFTELATTGVYTQELKSVDGCDSTLTLNLTVLSGDTTRVEFTIKTTDLPYDYQGLLYYDKSTLAGTYIDTLVVETENCEEVIIHTLIVELVDAIDNVHTFDLVMVPNPVAVNGTLYINAEFSAEERDGMTVEVFNAIGQCVYVDTPSIYPIEISGLQERGMYIVRIVTGNGKSYTGKLIVE